MTKSGTQVAGSGNSTGCSNLVRYLLEHHRVEPLVAVKSDFYAMSGYFYTAYALGLVKWHDAKKITPHRICDRTKKFCRENASTAQIKMPKHVMLSNQTCFRGHLVCELL